MGSRGDKLPVASVLSDLVSLRVCDHTAALALVSTYKTVSDPSQSTTTADLPSSSKSRSSETPNTTTTSTNPGDEENLQEKREDANDADLQRALDLVELHYGVKERYKASGMRSETLEKARAEVDRVLGEFVGR